LARRRDLSTEAAAIARAIDANPALAVKDGRKLKLQVYSLLSAIMTQEVMRAREETSAVPMRKAKPNG
jgi:hypothetical protein